MLFNSYIFILLFLPLCLAGYFVLNAKKRYEWGKTWLLAMSLWFYAYFNIKYLPIIVGSILINYVIYRYLLGRRGDTLSGNGSFYITAIGVAANLGVLFYYKYYDFFIENINILFRTDWPLQRVLLPLGISFFTFQQVGFLVDTYRGETPNYSFLDYALFVTFFPQLIAGPIVTHDEMLEQFSDEAKKKWNWENFSLGFYAFVCGLAKKVLLADIFGKAVDWGFSNADSISGISVILLIVSYTVQLYFDFSGYCDMARGIGLMFNIEIALNFDSPYKAIHLVDFWKRWHITLNRFFTRYVYIPLGGNRKGAVRTYFNIFMIYLVSGIWHGANWTYVVWGIMHGIVYVLTRRFLRAIERVPHILTWFVNMLFFMFSLIFFRSDNLQQAVDFVAKIGKGGYKFADIPSGFIEQFRTGEFFYLLKVLRFDVATYGNLLLMIGYMLVAWGILLLCPNVNEQIKKFKPTVLRALYVVILFLWSLVSFSEVSAFLYFNF